MTDHSELLERLEKRCSFKGATPEYYAAFNDAIKAIRALQELIAEMRERDMDHQLSLDIIGGTARTNAELEQNCAFYKCCLLSGEIPKEGNEPFPSIEVK